jgi:glycosyltransferase involved in cell wall biosynthesis
MTYSVVIASYKYGHLASHCIESVLAQTKPFDKIYFVDDGAGDCGHLRYLYPQVDFLLRKENLGIVANFQDMLENVETDKVMFLGADNWLRSDALAQLSQQDSDIVTYDIIVTGELRQDIYSTYSISMKPYQGDWYWQRARQHHGSILYDVQKALSVGGYEDNKKSGRTDEDENLWDKLNKAGATISYIPQGLLYYRRHKENFNKY